VNARKLYKLPYQYERAPTYGHWKVNIRGGLVNNFAVVARTLGHDLADSLLVYLALNYPCKRGR
jgi:hypothetical protein